MIIHRGVGGRAKQSPYSDIKKDLNFEYLKLLVVVNYEEMADLAGLRIQILT